MRKFCLLLIFLWVALPAAAQSSNRIVRGRVLEGDTSLPAIQAAVQFLSPRDSSCKEATVCDIEGNFSLEVPYGDYILKIATMGYTPLTRNIHHIASTSGLDLGTISLSPEMQLLQAAEVAAKVEPVKIIGDTVAYNAAAFRVAEDATLEELLKKIPGMEISGSTVTLQGKPITQIFINGKRFFGNDVKAGLKSLDANMVEQIRAYERESDFTRLTGVDDGETEDVLDIKIKKSMMDGFRGSVTGGYGRGHDESPVSEPQPEFNGPRYVGRGSLNRITKKDQLNINAGISDIVGQSPFSNTNNNRLGGGAEGLRDNIAAGVNISRTRAKSEISGSVQFLDTKRHTERSVESESISSTLNKQGERVFSSTLSGSKRRTDINNGSLKVNLNMEFHPDKQLTVIVRPNVQYNYDGQGFENTGDSWNSSNKHANSTHEFNDSKLKRINATVNSIVSVRSAKKRGRTLTGRVDFTYYDNNLDTHRDIQTHYYLVKSKIDKQQDSIRYVDYLQGNGDSYFREIVNVAYNEPFAKRFYFQGSVQLQAQQFSSVRNVFMPSTVASPVPDKSYLGTYDYFNIPVTLSIRYSAKKFGLTFGGKALPQFGVLNYAQQDVWTGTRTFVFNFAPDVFLRYTKSKTEKLTLRYTSAQWAQSLYNLIPLENGVQGLSVHKGNSDLKPSFKHMIKLAFNRSDVKAQNSIILNAAFNLTQNAVATSSEFSDLTGARIYVPKNIDGNWDAKVDMVFNKTFKNNHFSMSSNTVASYTNSNNLLYNSKLREDELNTMGRFMVRESLDFSYRNDWLEWIVNARGDYTNESSRLRPDLSQQPFNVSAGTELTFTFPWNMRLNLNFSAVIQRGYVYNDFSLLEEAGYGVGNFNDNFYYLNASISQPFFHKKLTVRLEGVNLLDHNVNLVRGFSAASRSISVYNGTGRYVILSLIYRFKL